MYRPSVFACPGSGVDGSTPTTMNHGIDQSFGEFSILRISIDGGNVV